MAACVFHAAPGAHLYARRRGEGADCVWVAAETLHLHRVTRGIDSLWRFCLLLYHNCSPGNQIMQTWRILPWAKVTSKCKISRALRDKQDHRRQKLRKCGGGGFRRGPNFSTVLLCRSPDERCWCVQWLTYETISGATGLNESGASRADLLSEEASDTPTLL